MITVVELTEQTACVPVELHDLSTDPNTIHQFMVDGKLDVAIAMVDARHVSHSDLRAVVVERIADEAGYVRFVRVADDPRAVIRDIALK